MTDALARGCERAVHVITPAGPILRAGRASLYVLDQVGWCRTARLLSRRPFIWAVEVGYFLVARNRSLFSKLMFRAH
jgi:hypothetical protein